MPFNQNQTERGIGTFPVIYTERGMAAPGEVPEVLLGRPGELPEGVYDTMLVRDGQVCDWRYHWERFLKSCSDLGLRVPEYSSERAITEWGQRTPGGELQCRMTSFREEQYLHNGAGFRTMVLIREFAGIDPAKGITCAVAPGRRRSDDLSYRYKRTGKIEEERALDEARVQGYGDVLFMNDRDEICEAAYSNVVLVKNGALHVPGEETACLPGVTVKVLLETATKAGVPVVRGAIRATDLDRADEVWLTSSLRGVQWVKQVGLFEGAEQPGEESLYLRLLADSVR